MARFPEQRLWDTMKRNKPPWAWLQRVENLCVEGMPDVWSPGAWVELKDVKLPARGSSKLLPKGKGLSQDQINWHLKADWHGTKVFTLVRADRELFLFDCPNEVNHLTVDEARAARLACAWNDIFQHLR